MDDDFLKLALENVVSRIDSLRSQLASDADYGDVLDELDMAGDHARNAFNYVALGQED